MVVKLYSDASCSDIQTKPMRINIADPKNTFSDAHCGGCAGRAGCRVRGPLLGLQIEIRKRIFCAAAWPLSLSVGLFGGPEMAKTTFTEQNF